MDATFLQLLDDGTVVGATNCRTLAGTWIETGSEVLFTNFSADGECAGNAAADLDSRIIGVLGDGFRAEIDDDRLTLTASGSTGLSYRSEE